MDTDNKSLKINNKNGFTIIELMVAVILIAIVIFIAFNMQLFSYGIFDKGSSIADIQSNLRINSEFISEKVRYASNVEVLANKPTTFASSTDYIYSDLGVLKYTSNGTTIILPGQLEGVNSTLEFGVANTSAINFSINGSFKNEVFSVDSAVSLLNIGDEAILGDTGEAILFTPGVAVNTGINAKPVISIIIETVDPSGVDEIGITDEVALIANVTPADASKKTVTWSVTGDGASISSTDHISAVLSTNGATIDDIITVRADAEDDSGKFQTYDFTVIDSIANIPADSVVVYSYMFGTTSNLTYIFKRSGKLQLKAEVSPSGASQIVDWTNNKGDTVALIDATGLMTTTSFSTNTNPITVKATTSNGKEGTKQITIVNNLDYEDDEIQYVKSSNTFTFYRDGKTIPLTDAAGVYRIKCQITKNKTSDIIETKESDSNSVTFSSVPSEAKYLILTYTTLNGETKVRTFELK